MHIVPHQMTEAPPIGRALLGAGVALFFVVGGLLLEGGHVSAVLQTTAFLIVAGGCVAAGVMGGLRLDSMAKAAVGMGVVGQVLGLIHVMETLDKPEAIGPGIAVAFIAALYGCLLWALFSALQNDRVTRQLLRGERVDDAPESLEMPALALAGTMTLLFVTFVVLYALQMPAH